MDGKKAFLKKAKVHKTETVYKGKLFSCVTEDITLPNGARTEMAIVRHPGSIGILPLLDEEKVVMIKQYRHSVGDYLLEIPADTMEPGESPLHCARRELEEETGLMAREFVELSQVYIIPAYSDEKIHVYLARGFTASEQNLDQDEIIQVVEYPPKEVLHSILPG